MVAYSGNARAVAPRVYPRRQESKRPAASALTRNILISGVTLTCVGFSACYVSLFSGDNYGSAASYVASRDALKVALADPAAAPVVKRDLRVAIETPATPPRAHIARLEGSSTVPKTAAPVARVAAASNFRPASQQMSPTQLASAEAVPFPIAPAEDQEPKQPKAPERAPPRELIALAFANNFTDPETTGSLGKMDKPLAVKAAAAASKKPDTLQTPSPPVTAKLSAVVPTKPAPPAKPARPLTPQEKLWGPVKVASLSPADALRESGNVATVGLPRAPYDPQTAVYVIESKTVYLPDGRALEAHSGLGEYMDNPRFAHLRMRGVTPPHVYDMKLRESLFHGVEAIRLKPIGGEEAIHGRDGLLAHTYMLGPNGQSNGCVSFKDYRTFLNAFKAGNITRLAVIPKLD
jgi:hypothetical protein